MPHQMAPSLLRRIVLRLSLTTGAAIVCAYGWLWFEFQATVGSLREQSLIETARILAEALTLEDGRWSVRASPRLLAPFEQPETSAGFVIRDFHTGTEILHVGGDVGPIPAGKVIDEEEDGVLYSYQPPRPGAAPVLGEYLPFTHDGHRFAIQVVRPSENYGDLIDTVLVDFFEDGGWLAAPFLMALLAVSILTIRSTLRPLRQLSEQAEAIGPRSPGLRLPYSDVPREVLPLVSAVNNALERLEDGYRHQRDFTADAAHELRTPLAILSAHIDTLPDQSIAEALRRDLRGMIYLVEQLLRVSRAESLIIQPSETTDLSELARTVACYLAPMAIKARKTIEVEAPDEPITIHGQEDALFHAIRNLVENGIRHTAVGTAVTIGVQRSPLMLWVRDCGPGISDAHKEMVFQRFWRADRQTIGSGLGLSIVRQTMEAHGGDVSVHDAPGGGAEFRLYFSSQDRSV